MFTERFLLLPRVQALRTVYPEQERLTKRLQATTSPQALQLLTPSFAVPEKPLTARPQAGLAQVLALQRPLQQPSRVQAPSRTLKMARQLLPTTSTMTLALPQALTPTTA